MLGGAETHFLAPDVSVSGLLYGVTLALRVDHVRPMMALAEGLTDTIVVSFHGALRRTS